MPKRQTKKEHHFHHQVRHDLRHFLIPHEGNNYHPHALRRPALRLMSVALIGAKLALVGFLFLLYPSPAQFASLSAGNIVSLTNESREANGLSPLSVDSKLTSAAQAKAADILARDYFAHTTPDGKRFYEWIQEAGYSYLLAGENLALDFSSAESVHTALLASTSHRENILNPKFENIGVAVQGGNFDGRETFVLVEMFGDPYTQTQPPEPQPTPEPTPNPIPEPSPKPTPQPTPESINKAEIVSRSAESLDVIIGQSAAFVINYKNAGEVTWTNGGDSKVALNVDQPLDRISQFKNGSWPANTQASVLTESAVTPGQTGSFSVSLTAPQKLGEFAESFTLVDSDTEPIDGSAITMPIRVLNPVVTITRPQAEVAGETENNNQLLTNEELAKLIGSNQELQTNRSVTIVDAPRQAINIVNTLFWVIFIFLIIALLLNIVIEARQQHAHVIFHTVLLIIMAGLMITVKLHFLENLPQAIQIV